MQAIGICAECGTPMPKDAPGGVCPVCSLRGALASGDAVAEAVVTEKAGDRIGHYKLVEKIGEGGFGVVYMADQMEPIRRRVAFKIIKVGMDTKQVIARFEAERQALALMDHPHIARVLDAGATETGRPFFVMELVRGIPITAYCDQHGLSTKERLDLFIQVCHAIQHAHQKGIIHRDIKPSNILVTEVDGVAVSKVIDFGIAKATNQQFLSDKTLFTAFRQFMGTPAYMSPEQADMSGAEIDTRSDVYALGVLLYELLTGKTPFEAKELMAVGLEAMRRVIQEQDPPRPSTRLGTMREAELTFTAQMRSSDAPKLVRLLRGDLDWIVMKCLEKERERRYETANALAEDLNRHLNHEVVTAAAPDTLYRIGKFIRRHRYSGAAVGVVVALSVAGGTVSTLLAMQANKAKKLTNAAQVAQAAQIYPRGLAYAEYGYWKTAEIYFLRAVQLNPDNHWYWYQLAPILAETGQLEEYNRLCVAMLARFGATNDPAIAERTAKVSLLFPAPEGFNRSNACRLAATALALGKGSRWVAYYQATKGLAEYRLGHFEKAIAFERKALDQTGTDPSRDAQAYAVLAMAYQRMNHGEQARDALATATEITRVRLPKLNRGSLGESFHDVLIADILLREAKTLINGRAGEAGRRWAVVEAPLQTGGSPKGSIYPGGCSQKRGNKIAKKSPRWS